MYIDQEFLSKWNIKSYQFKDRFYSKKNQVSLIRFVDIMGRNWEWVVKKYNISQDSLNREVEILNTLYKEGLSVPRLIYRGDDYLIMEYVSGKTLLEFIEEKEMETQNNTIQFEVLKAIENLAHWLKKYYKILDKAYGKNLIVGDVNFRNFIVGDKIYGVDFENYRRGRVEEDIGKLCAFALTYNPPFTTWKCILVDSLKEIMSEILEVSIDAITIEMVKELDEIIKRRNMGSDEA
jgi:hypothetical protein